MGSWAAPAAATAFAAGILVTGLAPRMAGGLAWALLGAGASAVVWAALRIRVREPDPEPLLLRAGLVAPVEDRLPPSARESILNAARVDARADAGSEPGSEPPGRAPPVRVGVRVAAAALAGLVLAGAGWGSVRASRSDRSALATLAGGVVRAEATLTSDPRDGPYGWSASAKVAFASTTDGMAWRLAEPVWLNGRDRAPPLELGDRVRLSANVGSGETGDFGDYLRSKGIGAVLRIERIERTGGPVNPLLRAANAVRRSLRRAALAVLPERQAGLLLGLALGDTSRLHPAVEEDFRATGLGHLVAVSGANVAMFLAPLLGLAMAARLRVRGRFVVGMLGLAFFALLTRAEPSVLRASAMAAVMLVGMLLGRRGRAPAVMGTAVLVLLVWDPALVTSLGFQLSVAATIGMVAFAGPVAERIPGPRAVALAAGATIGAQAVVTPLLLLRFSVVPTTTLPANLLAFPAVGPAMLFGLAASTGWLVVPGLGMALAPLARLPLAYLIGVADRMATLPLPSITSSGGLLPFVLSLAVVAWLAWRISRRGGPLASPPRRHKGPVLVAVVALVVQWFVWTHAVRAGPPSSLEVRFLDVGQGDAALIRSPGGAAILIDAGPERDVVAAKLAAAGVHRLDVVVATHAHADHVAGFPPVFARFAVGLVLEPGCPAESPSYAAFKESVREEQLRVRHPRPNEVILAGDVRLEILSPTACHIGTASDANNDSIVIRVVRGDASVLFTGDAEDPAQEALLEGDPSVLWADVLKVPHHGGGTSTPEFLVASGAEVAVVSSGADNDYGHPVPWVLATLRAAGMDVWRTDLSGDVVVRFGPDGEPYVESAA